MANIAGLIGQYQASQATARRANVQRYRQGLRILRTGYRTATRQAQRFGQSALRDVEESATQQKAGGEQDLISRGLGGTTIRGAMTRAVERERLRGRSRIGEQRSMLLGQLAQQRAQDIAGFIERRSDVGPDLGMFSNLLQAAGQGGTSITGGYGAPTATRQTTTAPFSYPTGSIREALGWGGGGGGNIPGQPGTVTGGGGFDPVRNELAEMKRNLGGGWQANESWAEYSSRIGKKEATSRWAKLA